MTGRSIFSAERLFNIYEVEVACRGKLMGGTPMNPNVIGDWLLSKIPELESGSAEFEQLVRKTMKQIDIPGVTDEMTLAELQAVAKEHVGNKHTVGFKRDKPRAGDPDHWHSGAYVESRQLKAMLKENASIVFAGIKFGPTRKGGKNWAAERLFVDAIGRNPDYVYLGFAQEDGTEQIIGHVDGPKGPQSTLTNYQYVTAPVITFTLKIMRVAGSKGDFEGTDECLTQEQVELLFVSAQENGLGACRSQSFGRFDVTYFGAVREQDERARARREIRAEILAELDLAGEEVGVLAPLDGRVPGLALAGVGLDSN